MFERAINLLDAARNVNLASYFSKKDGSNLSACSEKITNLFLGLKNGFETAVSYVTSRVSNKLNQKFTVIQVSTRNAYFDESDEPITREEETCLADRFSKIAKSCSECFYGCFPFLRRDENFSDPAETVFPPEVYDIPEEIR